MKKIYLMATIIAAVCIQSCKRYDDEPINMQQPADTQDNAMTPEELQNMKSYGTPVRFYDTNVPTTWFNLQLTLIKSTKGFSPPVASRAIGYSGITLYESLRKGMPSYQSIAPYIGISPALPNPQQNLSHHWPSVANASLAEIFRKLFNNTSDPNNAAHLNTIDSLENAFKNQFINDPVVAPMVAVSESYGHQVADAVYAWSQTDAVGNDGFLKNNDPNYIPPTGSGMWVPTAPTYSPCVQPHWGSVRPFLAADTTGQCLAGIPLAFSTDTASDFYKEAKQVYDVGTNLTATQITIATYWADGSGSFTPPGHWVSLLNQQLASYPKYKLSKAAVSYAKLGMAVTDAFISCWRSKYIYCLLRPVSYINDNIDANWSSLIPTPPFPEYTSGHSTQSGAASAVLGDLFGAYNSFTDNSKVPDGFAPRTFTSFSAAAQEAAVSRLYGGIHYPTSNTLGYNIGINIGNNINAIPFLKP